VLGEKGEDDGKEEGMGKGCWWDGEVGEEG